jgi:hypothetical protein
MEKHTAGYLPARPLAVIGKEGDSAPAAQTDPRKAGGGTAKAGRVEGVTTSRSAQFRGCIPVPASRAAAPAPIGLARAQSKL